MTGYSEPPYFGLLRGRSLALVTACQFLPRLCIGYKDFFLCHYYDDEVTRVRYFLKRALWKRSQNSTSVAVKAPQILSDGKKTFEVNWIKR